MKSKESNILQINEQNAFKWLTTKEAARYLSVSENALRIMVHRG